MASISPFLNLIAATPIKKGVAAKSFLGSRPSGLQDFSGTSNRLRQGMAASNEGTLPTVTIGLSAPGVGGQSKRA